MANSYDHILTLAEVKRYLRLDENFTEDDPDIENMIAASLEYITKQTNYVFKAQDKTYYQDYHCNTFIYDYPVNTSDFSPNIPLQYSGYIKFRNSGTITANVGFSDKTDVNFPHALVECAKQMIKVFYYEAEKNVNTTLLPMSVNETINTYRRFIML